MNKRYIPVFISLLLFAVIPFNIFGQARPQQKLITIESVIVDENGAPVPNAVILGKEGAVETLSDAEGKFSIEIPENSVLMIEADGYNTLHLSTPLLSDKITILKAPFLMAQDDLVHIPFGKITRKETVGALSVVNPNEFVRYDNNQDIYDVLLARVPGLLGSSNIRGLGPVVFVVDGIPRDPSNLSVEEVDQITVLKDVNAGLLYGVQAENGLIMITTKRGEAGRRKINFSLEQGLSKPIALPKYLNSADYMTLYDEALTNDDLSEKYGSALISQYASGNNPYRYPSVDYYSSEFLRNMMPFTRFIGEFSGGNQITRYYANLGWQGTGSLYKLGEGQDARSDRFNLRANIDIKITDFLKSSIDAAIIFDVDKGPNGDFWADAATLQPQYYSPLLPVSSVNSDAAMLAGASLETAKLINGGYILGGTSQYYNNAYGNMFLSGYNQFIQRTVSFNQANEVDLKSMIEGLKFRTFITFDIYNSFNQTVENLYAVYQPEWEGDKITSLTKIGKDEVSGIQDLNGVDLIRRIGAYGMLDYAKTFNDVHSVKGTLLAYFNRIRVEDVINDDKYAHLGLRLTYDYAKKYFIDFSSTLVNSAKLAEGSRGGLSPSLGLAWVISEEDFLSGSGFVNYLKLRASAGIINTDIGITNPSGSSFYLYENTFTEGYPRLYWNDGSRSLTQTVVERAPNSDLTFEKIKNLNIGFEGYFLGRSLYVDANLFTNRRSGIVIQRSTLPAYLGAYRPFENYNENGYTGGELGLVWSKSLGEISMDLGTNFLYATSNMVKRDEIWEYDYQYREGRPVDAVYGLEAIGFFRDASDITNSPSQMFGEVAPGDIKYADQNDDDIIDENDMIKIGNSQARFSYGLNVNLKYRNFNLFAIGNGRIGSDAMYSGDYFWVQGNDKYSEEVLGRWTPSTAESATYPKLTSKSSANNFRTSTFWLYNNNYFTLNRVQLTYDVARSFANKVFMKDLCIYLRGDNLARLSEDSEKRQLRIGQEPLYRSYALGVRMMF